VPLFAIGAGAQLFAGYADLTDPIRGQYLDNTKIFPVMAAQVPLPGDADCDGTVDFADYQVVERNFGSTAANWGLGDFTGDWAVTFADYQALERNFGRYRELDADFAQVVPEPAALTVLLAGLAILLRR
jgi:hypothetical protein